MPKSAVPRARWSSARPAAFSTPTLEQFEPRELCSAVTLSPSDDATVRGGGSADINLGGEITLSVKASANPDSDRAALLTFDLGKPDAIEAATLKLWGSVGDVDSVAVAVYDASGTGWSESDVTWNNAPAVAGAAVDTVAIDTVTNRWWAWDVTDLLRAKAEAGATRVSFVVRAEAPTPAAQPAEFSSGEAAAHAPQLVLRTAPAVPDDHATPEWVSEVPVIHYDPSRSLLSQLEEQTEPVKFVLPAGVFHLSDTASINTSNFAFVGAGKRRTIIECDAGGLRTNFGTQRNDIYLEGLAFTSPSRTFGDPRFDLGAAQRDSSLGLAFYGGTRRLHVNNCSFSRFTNGIVLDPQEGRAIRRVRMFAVDSTDNYHKPDGFYGQGIYAAYTYDFVFASGTLARNGRSGIPRWENGTMYTHGAYINKTSRNILFVDSKILFNAADGIQLRPGGGRLVYNGQRVTGGVVGCRLVGGGHGVWCGPDPTVISRNEFRGNAWNIGIGGDGADRACRDALVEDNVIYASKPIAHRGVEGIRSSGHGNRVRLFRNVVAVESRNIRIRGIDTLLVDVGNVDEATPEEVSAKLAELFGEATPAQPG